MKTSSTTSRPADMPEHIAEAVGVLGAAGWVTFAEAAQATGRSAIEIARLWDAEEVGVVALGGWLTDGVPRAVHLVRLAQVAAAPSRPSLRSV